MSPETEEIRPRADQLGPGTLALVVGASGVGKDALIAGARTILARDARFAFPERIITRPPHNAENHASLSEAEFIRAAQEGRFALTWEAHGLCYGVPASIDEMIRDSRTVVVNASRAIAGMARRRYARVCLVLVECPLAIRAARLAHRGRETHESVEARLARQIATFDPADADVRIDNSGPLHDGVRAFVEALRTLPGHA
ncbi:MAG: phosphonate metabolism protein/1,5-bisphosphokinase (PRPP-forming) PhnN [Hyphomicrobiaceae bacterium]